MIWSQAANLKRLCLRAIVGGGLVAVTAAPSAAQPGSEPGALASTRANRVIQLSAVNPTPGDQEVRRSPAALTVSFDQTMLVALAGAQVTFGAPMQSGDYLFCCDVDTSLMTGTFAVMDAP
jgi:hypothetical protein